MFGNPTIFNPVVANTKNIVGAWQINGKIKFSFRKERKSSQKPLIVKFGNPSILAKLLYIPAK